MSVTDMDMLERRIAIARERLRQDDKLVQTCGAGGLTPETAIDIACLFLATGERLGRTGMIQ